jgi:hypothetical protein
MSQGWIRKHSPSSGNPAFFGDSFYGYEIVPGNIQQALRNVGVSYESWKGTDSSLFFLWMKKHLRQGNPIVWFVQSATSTYVEHAEPVVGYYSKYPLTHDVVYPDDMIRYHNNIELLSYYRRVDSFVDKGNQINCTKGESFGTECISPNFQVGIAIKGMEHSKSFKQIKVHISISDGGMEGKKWISTQLTISNIKMNTPYEIIRVTDQGEKIVHQFITQSKTKMIWKDHNLNSKKVVYYYVKTV